MCELDNQGIIFLFVCLFVCLFVLFVLFFFLPATIHSWPWTSTICWGCGGWRTLVPHKGERSYHVVCVKFRRPRGSYTAVYIPHGYLSSSDHAKKRIKSIPLARKSASQAHTPS